MRQQREIMYKERDDIMSEENLDAIVKGMTSNRNDCPPIYKT